MAWTVAGFAAALSPNALIGVGAPIVVTIYLGQFVGRFYEGPLVVEKPNTYEAQLLRSAVSLSRGRVSAL
jgi:hypothetical protein